ncbi:MAG: HD domain-containing protein [archaeon]
MDTFDLIKKEAEEILLTSESSHDWEHTERVLNMCLRLGEKEKADLEVLRLAAVLHDIGREQEHISKGKICHAQTGSELAKDILLRYNLDNEKINKIIHCIQSHRYRGDNLPKSKEAKILFDADKLDAIGATGIGRAFLFAGSVNAKLHNGDVDIEKTNAYTNEDTAFREFTVKLKKVKDRLLTNEGKKIAEDRHNFMVGFFDRLDKETTGQL